MIIASLALFVAIGGSAYATVTISGGSIADHSIAGRKLINNTLTGKQIKESRLGAVPKANSAGNAKTVGHITVRKVFYAPTTTSATPKTILQLGGLVLKATCRNGDLEVVMTSTVDHAHLASEMWNSAGGGNADGLHHSDFGPNSASHLESLGDGNAYGETSFTYTRANGTIVNGQVSFDSSDLNPVHPGDGDIFNNTAKCLVSGLVMSTTAAR
ncbi:MAG: hypothetical protein QOD39_2140 [Mycobacterium sp.]|nr:hypothetical protein [Mycobacterium sp.]